MFYIPHSKCASACVVDNADGCFFTGYINSTRRHQAPACKPHAHIQCLRFVCDFVRLKAAMVNMATSLISFLWNVSGLLTSGITIKILTLKLKGTTLSLSIRFYSHTRTHTHICSHPHMFSHTDRLISSFKQEDSK